MNSMKRTKANKRTAAADYADRQTECQDLLKRIAAQLEQHRSRQATDPRNWGYVGDLEYAAEHLAYVLASLGDRSAVDQKGLAW